MSDNERRDFVWRFRLDEEPQEPVYADPLLELTRVQWEQLLKLCIPHYRGKPLQIDGFALMRDIESVHAIFREENVSV